MFNKLKNAVASVLLKEGDSGEPVKVLQNLLAKAGMDPGVADGIFGGKTTDALKGLQEKLGLDADGVYGPNTASGIMKYIATLSKK